MFPRTTLELLVELAEIHRAEYDKAVKALDALSDDEKIAKAYEKAEDRVVAARNLVAAIDQVAKRERERLITHGPDVSRSVMQEAADIVNSGALDHDGTTVTAIVRPAVDPITGEVTSKANAVSCDTCGRDCNLRQREGSGHTGCGGGSWEPRKPEADPITGEVEAPAVERYDRICSDCGGDGRLEDRTGGGHHRCRACAGTGKIAMERPATPYVLVAWPDNPDMQRIEVGPLTRYGELAAKFLNSLPGDDPRREDSFLDYRVVDVGTHCALDLHATIASSDYRLEFSVEPGAK